MPCWLRAFGRVFMNAFVLLLFGCGLAFSLWRFSASSLRDAQDTLYMYLRQAAEQCATSFLSQLEEKFTTLEILADAVAVQPDILSPSALELARIAALQQSILRINIVTPTGAVHGSDGSRISIADRPHFIQALRVGRAVSNLLTLRAGGMQGFAMAVPIRRGGKTLGVLTGTYSVDAFNRAVTINAFGGKGYIYVIERDGGVVLNPLRPPLGVRDDFFELSAGKDGQELGPLRKGMEMGETGALHIPGADGGLYLSYVPVGLNGWYVLAIIPEDELDRQFATTRERAFSLSGELALLLIGLFAYIYRIRRRDARHLASKHRELRALTDNVIGGVLKSDTDVDFTLDYMSSGYLDLMGYTREAFAERFQDKLLNTILEEDRDKVRDGIRTQILRGDTIELEFRSLAREGRTVWFYYKGRLVRDGDRLWCYAIAFDATAQHALMEREKLANERYRFIMDQHAIIIFEWNIREDRLSASARWLELLGKEGRLFRGDAALITHVHPDDRAEVEALFRRLADGQGKGVCEARITSPEVRRAVWYRIEASTLFGRSGEPVRVMGLLIDIDMQKTLELSLRDRAERDSATGLYNKATARRLVERLIAGENGKPGACALLLLDLDDFKAVNDTLGHGAGDTVIVRIASVLQRHFRHSDIVGRIGGDEFAVCVPGLSNRHEIAGKAAGLLREIERSFDDFDMDISASIGIALAPGDDGTFTGLYRKADEALYLSKHKGKNCFSFYDELRFSRFDNHS